MKILNRWTSAYAVANANTDPTKDCGAGINVATMDWCLKNWRTGYRVLVVEFTAEDIACIPIASDGKIRLHRCTVVGEKTLDELGITAEMKAREEYEASEKAKAAEVAP